MNGSKSLVVLAGGAHNYKYMPLLTEIQKRAMESGLEGDERVAVLMVALVLQIRDLPWPRQGKSIIMQSAIRDFAQKLRDLL